MRESYYITPTRLQKNPHLWKTIDMLKIVNEELPIVTPKATSYWMMKNWNKVTPGNAVLVLDNSDISEYRWSDDTAAAATVLTFAIKNGKDSKHRALRSKYTPEKVITEFISTLDPSDKTVSKVSHYYGESIPLAYAQEILNNPGIKTYQIEMIWNLLSKVAHRKNLIDKLKEFRSLKILPDYIFIEVFTSILTAKEEYYYGSVEIPYYREALRRGFLKQEVPVQCVVPSQPIPNFEKAAETKIEMTQSPQANPLLKPLLPGRVINITLK